MITPQKIADAAYLVLTFLLESENDPAIIVDSDLFSVHRFSQNAEECWGQGIIWLDVVKLALAEKIDVSDWDQFINDIFKKLQEYGIDKHEQSWCKLLEVVDQPGTKIISFDPAKMGICSTQPALWFEAMFRRMSKDAVAGRDALLQKIGVDPKDIQETIRMVPQTKTIQ